jgi:carboxylesterase
VDTLVSIPGAEPWSARGTGTRGRTGVVVIHGFTANPVGTRPLGQRLAAEGYTVEVPLLPGHGTTPRDLARTRYDDWYDCVERVLDDLLGACDRVVLVGHSLGGTITLDLASRRPADVTAAVVINPQVVDPTQPLAKLAPLLQYVLPYVPRDLGGLPSNDIARPGADERAYGVIAARAARSLIAQLPRIRMQLLDITQPLLVVRSPQDHTVPPNNATELLDLVASPDRRQLVCDRSYHVPQLDHDADRVAEAIVAFLAEVA